jgi:hypothetical protein
MWPGPYPLITKANSSITHQDHSSPGSTDRRIGCAASSAWRLACRPGEESQQPIFPHVWLHPAAARLQALLAAGDLLRRLDDLDLVEVIAASHQSPQ